MWVKGTFLILFALIIDGLQLFVSWMFLAIGTGLAFITPVGGAAGGAATGAYLCWNSTGGVLSAAAAAIKCGLIGAAAGAAISAFGIPIGTALGFAVNICISLTMGAGLILALVLCGMYYPSSFGMTFVIEALPGLNVLPGWTFMVVRCMIQKQAEKVTGKVEQAVTKVAPSFQPSSFRSDITPPRPTNDNALQPHAQAA